MIKCLKMKKTFLKKIPPKKICITKISKHVCDETNDQMSETQFFVFFNVFPRFKNRNNPMVCMLIFIFTLFPYEPKKFCELYYTNIVININSRVQTLIYFEKVNSSFWKAGTTVFVSLLYHKIFSNS